MELMCLLFFSEILMTDAQLKCICGTWYTFTLSIMLHTGILIIYHVGILFTSQIPHTEDRVSVSRRIASSPAYTSNTEL